MTPFGEKIRALRAQKGVSQAQMAADLEVSPAYLSALEHGKRGAPSWAMIQRIIQYFGLIWDDAERLQVVAQFSRPKVSINTAGLSADATRAANLLARKIQHLSQQEITDLLKVLDGGREP